MVEFLPPNEKAIRPQDNSGEIAGSMSYLTLIPLLPLNEFFKQSLGFIGPFFSRSIGGEFGNSVFRVFASLHRLKYAETSSWVESAGGASKGVSPKTKEQKSRGCARSSGWDRDGG
jgi:hypothetical protein